MMVITAVIPNAVFWLVYHHSDEYAYFQSIIKDRVLAPIRRNCTNAPLHLLPIADRCAGRHAAWAQRLAHYAREKRQTTADSAAGSLRLARERIELMKQYDILA